MRKSDCLILKMSTDSVEKLMGGNEPRSPGRVSYQEHSEYDYQHSSVCLRINLDAILQCNLSLNEYNNPSFATMFERALLNTYITTCFGLNPSHHQVL
jgi:hypothetical protein